MNRFTLIKRIIAGLLSVALMAACLSGCGETPTPGSSIQNKKPVFSDAEYTDFDVGLSAFFEDYLKMKEYVLEGMRAEKPKDSLESQTQRDYYDNFLLLMSVIDLELFVLDELDLIETTADYADRAEGELIISGYYGYKIKQGAGLKFGCDASEEKSFTGEIDSEGKFSMTVNETIDGDLYCKTIIEIVMESADMFVMRAAKSVINGEQGASVTKTAYILVKDAAASVAFYEGRENVESYIELDMLVNYNMNAITFGVGSVLGLEFELR